MKKPISAEQREKFLAHWKVTGEQILNHPEIGEWEIDSIIARNLPQTPRIFSATGVGVAVPCAPGRSTVEETLSAVSKLAFEFGLRPEAVQSFGIGNNREKLVRTFIDAGYRRLLFLDSDTYVDGEGFWQLMRTMSRWGAAVVGALVIQRYTGELNAFEEDSTAPSGYRPVRKEDIPSSLTAFPVPFVGLACALLDLEQIRMHPAPRFKRVEEGDRHLGEDVWFCKWVKDNGMDVIIDPKVSTLHCVQHRFGYMPPKRDE